MWSGLPKLLFVTVFAINCVLWSNSRYGTVHSVRSISTTGTSHFAKRSLLMHALTNSSDTVLTSPEDDQCFPIAFPVDQQCSHVMSECPGPRTFLSIPYLRTYFCADLSARPFIFAGYVLWLVFLFSTLGISASDFFCPNLGTLAQLLGLDENVAGVTFLAFGNGSPDVFATFSAMKSDSGSLAIGELLGAAAFITSCVVGSMCIIKPFRVNRFPFIRDVGFFMIAVTVLLVVLWDSKLEGWEAASLIGLYFFYVTIVVVGSWWENWQERKRRYEALIRDEFREEEVVHTPYHDDEEPYTDEISYSPASGPTLSIPYTRSRTASHPGPPRLGVHTELPQRPHTRTPSPQPASHMPSFSLIGALEFRRVVSSLQEQAASSSLSLFESPMTPYPGGHYHRHLPSSRSRTPIMSDEHLDPWDAALGLPLDDRSPRGLAPTLSHDSQDHQSVPTISRTPASPVSDVETESQRSHYIPLSRRQRIARAIFQTFHILFPTLQQFRSKSFLGKIASILAAPAVMALTLTLPVVVTAYEGVHPSEKAQGTENRLIDFEEEGVERALLAEEDVEEEIHELKFNKWLMAVQCTLGPLFSVAILFDGTQHEPWLLLAAGIAGLTVGTLVAVFADKGTHPTSQLARCTMGFMVAVVWIMAIADEVVEVLQTVAFIFGLSDAIIGLTIFAVGNSLADLVANMSVAVFAPIMGFSACFGGPMMNILLGVGISGSYIIRQTAEPYELHFSNTLIVTGTGLLMILLATLIFVPSNGYFLPRGWGIALIVAYICLMITNVVVEITT
ncbi:hypothetical protein CERSUDRAFT_117589 [Gelatoporia subvermispora B]|uniref:Sodium/calcium exchanger membrane region domain-containing protein n=1 Tax=Ceriporiopsis subvermispora (strain B) TaxID=914234 RepID=M2R595_CERS8|nr:hypothetical protein CERSUDRAFT_117589 [Gelatoporia subvermispora B]